MSIRATRADLKRLGIAVPGPTAPRRAMTRTEMRYAKRLDLQVLAGEIADWQFEPEILPLGYRCTFKPDFQVWTPDGFEFHEVKGGHVWEDSRIKLKWAAQKYAPIVFRLAQWRRGKWHVRVIPAE